MLRDIDNVLSTAQFGVHHRQLLFRLWRERNYVVSTLDILILIPLIPAAPVVITWWLPWGKWLFDRLPKYLTGPYFLYDAYAAWHFKWEWWFITLLAAAGMVLSVLAIANKSKESRHS